MRSNVKPLTHWIIYRGYKVRFTQRTPQQVAGILTTPTGEVAFTYDPLAQRVQWGTEQITINEYGWEMSTTTNE
jgi:spore germination cell wall hydrolase CwlJ-like protein